MSGVLPSLRCTISRQKCNRGPYADGDLVSCQLGVRKRQCAKTDCIHDHALEKFGCG